jgi:SdrD B-like domain
MKKLLFITLLISISTVFSFAQEAKKTNSEVTGSQTNEKQKQWLPSNFRAVSEVPVTLLTPTGEKVQSVTTDNQGVFNFTNVAAGKYIVAFGKYDVKMAKGLTEYRVFTPREAGSGMASGRRQYEPLIIRKSIDKSSPVLMKKDAACDDDCEGFFEVTLALSAGSSMVSGGASSAAYARTSVQGVEIKEPGKGGASSAAYASTGMAIQHGIEIKEPGIIGGRVSMTPTVGKQTQGVSFGEKTKQDNVKKSVGNIQ